ncbi:MAG: HPr(Ser) kinase/phosphatase [Oscillospiraceae bacterium]|nr:HPr(Ser) kinase/phosphatase [Oscillospiraceae bacterium]
MYQYTVPLHEIAEEFHLVPVHKATDYNRVCLLVADVTRPGLALTGYFEHFEPMRLQVMGMVEHSYISGMSEDERSIAFDRLFSYRIPALIYARDLTPPDELLQMAKKHNITVLTSDQPTAALIAKLIVNLSSKLAPRVTRHGVLVEVYGEGLLLVGESGVGKSEAAVELLKRGHRLIADDAVEIKQVSPSELVGTAPDVIRHYVELRGIGVTNVAQLFGMGAVKDSTSVDLLIHLKNWKEGDTYDRLGLEENYEEILGVKIPTISVPIKPGRNLAVILEVAAMNNRQKKMGYNAAKEFMEQINLHYDSLTQESGF